MELGYYLRHGQSATKKERLQKYFGMLSQTWVCHRQELLSISIPENGTKMNLVLGGGMLVTSAMKQYGFTCRTEY
eukprot:6645791-Ditylum_brightwellii.AAC.1